MKIAVFLAFLALASCGGDATDEEAAAATAAANGLPTGESIDCSGGDVTVTTGGQGDVVATGGDGGGCASAGEDEDDSGEFVDDGEPVPPFLGG
jgi:hypothetical protein